MQRTCILPRAVPSLSVQHLKIFQTNQTLAMTTLSRNKSNGVYRLVPRAAGETFNMNNIALYIEARVHNRVRRKAVRRRC
jgi:hypothetical protein